MFHNGEDGKIEVLKGGRKVRVLIVDDDLEFAKILKDNLFNHFSGITDETVFEIVTDNFSRIPLKKHYDLIFLDIGLPNNDGIELAKTIRKKGICNTIIFVSLHQHLVHNSLSARPFFFVRKTAYQKDLALLYELLDETLNENEYISFKWQGKQYMIKMHSIVYIESDNQSLNIHTTDKNYYTSMNLKDILKQLNPTYFTQIHKSYIINLNYLINHNSLTVELVGKVKINIGRSYKQDFVNNYKAFLIH